MKYIKLTDEIKAAMQQKLLEVLSTATAADAKLNVTLDTSAYIDKDAIKTPVIVIEEQASRKLWGYVEQCTKEIGWHGIVERTDDVTFVIKDVFLFPQTVTAATVTTDDDAYSSWIMGLDDQTFNCMDTLM